MAAHPRTERSKPLRLACWNTDGVRGRKLELEHFLSQHGVDTCLLSETFLNPGQAFRHANYTCHRTDRPTMRGGTAILVRRGTVHHSVPVPGLTQLEATTIQVNRQTGDSPCGLPFAFPPTDRSGPNRLFRRGIAGLDCRRSQRQTRGIELAA